MVIVFFLRQNNEPQRHRGHGGKKRSEKREKVNLLCSVNCVFQDRIMNHKGTEDTEERKEVKRERQSILSP
ncbi:MAG: hypothetical protein RLZZ338_1842 [Cyanobacteriota bacterium]|jgi:hypothetical protein